jgi:hypothetical protein
MYRCIGEHASAAAGARNPDSDYSLHMYVHTCMYAYMYICIYIYVCMYADMYV